jgi:hypothetical protein
MGWWTSVLVDCPYPGLSYAGTNSSVAVIFVPVQNKENIIFILYKSKRINFEK